MKKFYLPLVAAATLFGANAAFADGPSITKVWSKIYEGWEADTWNNNAPDWSNPDQIKTCAGTRVGTGMNGKVYAVNGYKQAIMAFGPEGYDEKAYALPSLEGRMLTVYATNEDLTESQIPDYYGTLITHDDAGNFIVGHGFTTSAMPNTWTVLNPNTGKSKTFDVEFAGAPKGTMQRIDVVGRALGDVTENGVLYVGPTSIYWANIKGFSWAVADIQRVKMIYFAGAENDENLDDLSAEGYVTPDWVALGGHINTVCQPRYSTMDEVNAIIAEKGAQAGLSETYLLSSRQAGIAYCDNQYSTVFGSFRGSSSANPFEDFAATDMGQNYSGQYGFDTFILGGKRYYVLFYLPNEAAYTYNKSDLNFAVFNDAGNIVAQQSVPEWVTNAGYANISVEPIDDTSVNIYLFAEASGVAGYTTSVPFAGQFVFSTGEASGISDIAIDEEADAPAVYYNLQGVEVANPESGIYVVRRGNKVSKEIVR